MTLLLFCYICFVWGGGRGLDMKRLYFFCVDHILRQNTGWVGVGGHLWNWKWVDLQTQPCEWWVLAKVKPLRSPWPNTHHLLSYTALSLASISSPTVLDSASTSSGFEHSFSKPWNWAPEVSNSLGKMISIFKAQKVSNMNNSAYILGQFLSFNFYQ